MYIYIYKYSGKMGSVGILRSRLNHVRNKKHCWNIRFLLWDVIEVFFSGGEGGGGKKKKKKRTAINFCNVIKINRDVALTNVRECDVTQIFISSNTGLFYATRKMKWVVHPRVDCDCLHATTTGKVYRYQGQTLPTEQQKSQISRTKSSIIS